MRLRVDIGTNVRELAWEELFTPVRAVAYQLIAASDPSVATELHDRGWAGHALRPLGGSCPQFRGAPRRRGHYTTSDHGAVWFGSPVSRIAGTLLGGVSEHRTLTWGSAEFTVRGVAVEDPPDTSGGELTVTTATPVLVKCDDRFRSPEYPGYETALAHNVRHKADLLGLPGDVDLEVLSTGPMRRFVVGQAPRHGATVTVRLSADPRLLTALYDWGLGLHNNQGFGWVR